jgi:hypothetical protein
MLAALVCAEDGEKKKEDRAIVDLAIIVGAAWPTCAAAKLETMSSDAVRSLHVIGATDAINPPAQALRVAKAFGANAQVFEHERGHIVPMTDDAMATYVNFIKRK